MRLVTCKTTRVVTGPRDEKGVRVNSQIVVSQIEFLVCDDCGHWANPNYTWCDCWCHDDARYLNTESGTMPTASGSYEAQ